MTQPPLTTTDCEGSVTNVPPTNMGLLKMLLKVIVSSSLYFGSAGVAAILFWIPIINPSSTIQTIALILGGGVLGTLIGVAVMVTS